MNQIVEVNGKRVEIKVNETTAGGSLGSYRNNILRWLSRIGIEKDYVSVDHSHYGYQEPFA